MMHMYTVFILITSLVGTIRSFSNYSNDDMSPFHHFSSSKDFLFVGGNRGITVLDKKNLNPTFEKEVGEVWLVLYNKLKNNIILCSKNDTIDTSSCRLLDTTTLASVGSVHSPMEINITITNLPVYVQTQVDTTDDVIVIGATSFQIKKLNENIWVADYSIVTLNTTDLDIFDTPNITGPMNLERGPQNDIVFKSTIATDRFVFFFFQIYNKNTFKKSRVGKLCKKTIGSAKNNGDYHSYEDIGITCMVNGSEFAMVERAVLVDNKTFIVILRNSQGHHAACTYSVKAVLNHMTSVRIDTLKCDNYFKKGSYFKPNLTVNNVECFTNNHCTGDTEFCKDAQGDFCDASHYSTLWDGRAIQSENSIIDTVKNKQHLTQLAIHSLKEPDSFVIFIGTDDGSLIMIHANLTDDSRVVKIAEKEATVTSYRIDDILIDNQSGVFVLTSQQIIKITYDDCKIVYSVDLRNPFCDWLAAEVEKPLPFMDDTSTIDITVSKTQFFIKQMTSEPLIVSFNLTEGQYGVTSCTFIGLNLTWTLNKTRHGYDCCLQQKDRSHIISGNYSLAIVIDEHQYNTGKKILFYICKDFKSCKDCIKKPSCGWKHAKGECDDFGYNYQDPEKCPEILGVRNDVYMTYAYSDKLVLNVSFKNSSTPPQSLQCEAVHGTFKVQSEAQFNSDSFETTCIDLNFTDEKHDFPEKAFFNIRLRYKGGPYIDGEIDIEVYTCSSNLSTISECSDCRNQNYPATCDWDELSKACYNQIFDDMNLRKDPVQVCPIRLLKVLPESGPVNGGTIVTLQGKNFIPDSGNISVYFDQTECEVLPNSFTTKKIECRTPGVEINYNISNITINVGNFSFPQFNFSTWFRYKTPKLQFFTPNRTIMSGGRSLTMIGHNIGFKGENRYAVYFHVENESIKCRDAKTIDDNRMKCLSGNASMLLNYTSLEVIIDTNTTLKLNQTLVYVKDPTGILLSNETASVQQSGGAKIAINGKGFNEVGKVTIDRVEKPCDITSDTLVECETPQYSGNGTLTGKVSQTVNVYFDGLAVPIEIDYVGDPVFEQFKEVLKYEKGSSINIKGQNIIAGARWNDYTIYIGKTGLCYTEEEHVSNVNIECWPPQHVPLTNYSDQNLVYIHLKVGRIRVHLGELRYVEETNHLVIVTSVLAAALVIAVAVGTGVILTMRKKRKKAEKKFMIELQSVEERIRTNSREEFAEMQIAIGDIQSDLVTSKVPYRGYQTYILMLLFPNQDPGTNSLLLNLEASDRKDDNYTQAVEKLQLLMQNKLFLKSLVQTLDRSNTLTAKEKAQFAALISVAMLGKMRLFYDLVNCLLTDTIRSVTKKQQRSLFRRLDSITCRMMTHFLQIVMYKQLQGQTGMQLFLLLKSVQTVMENGPVDAVTGHCKNTLCEEKLLKLRVDSEQHTLNIDLNGNSDHRYQVKVLECDTISQVKRKCCYQIYKNTPASEIPKFEELELEWNEGQAGRLLLQDIDQTSERTDGHLRLNTLSHYNVKHDCRMSLMYGIHEDEVYENTTRQSECASSEDVNLLIPDTMEGYDNLVKWHLSMSHFEEGPNPERDFGDIYLNRLFHTKLLLSKYIDSMFEGLLDSKLVSLPISYFIQTLEKLGKESMVDPDVIQIWKNECYGTRLWAPMIAKPQAAFDIHVPQYVEPVMDVLSHVFVESVTQTHSKVNKESPTHRLMFHKDVERYRRLIDTFYSYMEPVADHDFWKVLDQLSDIQKEQVKLSRQSTIHQLYNLFIARHKDKILMDFEDMEESRSLQFGQKLEEIFDLMEEQ